MSELKAVTVYDAYWKANSTGEGTGILVYLKSEADKVIAELKDKALQYKVLNEEHCRDLNTQERFFAEQIVHHKYKRCLAMAEWCDAEADVADADGDYEDMQWYQKWHKRWLELAEKFKPNNSTAQ